VFVCLSLKLLMAAEAYCVGHSGRTIISVGTAGGWGFNRRLNVFTPSCACSFVLGGGQM